MASKSISHYLRSMATSLLIMVLVTYGIATQNKWIQYGSVFVVLILQVGYMILKSTRAGPLLRSNMEDATRAKSGKILLKVTGSEVNQARAGVEEGRDMGMGIKTMVVLFVPLIIFMGSGYLLRALFPGLPQWQSFAIGFLITMPFSLLISAKAGIGPTNPVVTPEDYRVSSHGIIFEQMGRSYIIRFPLKRVNSNADKHFIEVEGQPSNTQFIADHLRLFTGDVGKLKRVLARFTETGTP